MFRFQLGDVIEVKHARLGLSSGKPYVVIGITETVGRNGEADTVVLDLWG